MRLGLPYLIRNVVVEFEENRRIAWRHFGRHVWRYELEPVDGGTRVRETWDLSQEGLKTIVRGYRRKTRANMKATLEHIERLVAEDAKA
jgi:hypothetical protein